MTNPRIPTQAVRAAAPSAIGAAAAVPQAAPGRSTPWGLYAAILVLIGILALPLPPDLPVAGHRMLAVLAFAIVVWITEAVSYEASAIMITSLMAALIGFAPTVADPATQYGTSRALGMALAGFSNTALALVAAALFISAAMTVTGLDRRIALVTLSAIGTSTRRILIGSIAVTIALSLVVPSATARSACVVPIMMGVIAAFGVDKKSNIAAGIMITVAMATSIWNVGIQTAAAQNLLTAGFMDKLLGERITWLQWLIASAPWAIVMSVVLYFLVRFLLPAETEAIPGGKEAVQKELAGLGPMSGPQKRLAAVSIGLLLFWATEGELHQFDTATVTFVGLVILMMPRIGVMDWKTMQQRTPWGTLIVFGVGISLGTALVTTQAGQWLGKFVVANSGLATQGPILVFAILAAFLILIHCQRHRAHRRAAADLDLGAADAAGRYQPDRPDHAARLHRELRLHPADQCASEHGLPWHGYLQRQAVRQGRHPRDGDRLRPDAAVRRHLLALAGLDLSAHREKDRS